MVGTYYKHNKPKQTFAKQLLYCLSYLVYCAQVEIYAIYLSAINYTNFMEISGKRTATQFANDKYYFKKKGPFKCVVCVY